MHLQSAVWYKVGEVQLTAAVDPTKNYKVVWEKPIKQKNPKDTES